MIDFSLSAEQHALQDAVTSFAQGLNNDGYSPPAFSTSSWQRCADIGLAGLTIDPEWGGQGASPIDAAIAFEAFGYGCRDNGLAFSLGAHLWSAATPIDRFGTEEQKQRWLRGLCDGSIIGVQAMTEPDTGSDAYAMTTSATQRGDSWILRGSKTYITNAPVAGVFVVFARTDPAASWAGLSAFLVPPDTPGLTVAPAFNKMGLESSPMSELSFDDCELGPDALIGQAGMGMSIFNHSIEWERAMILAPSVGAMRRQLEETIAFAKEREQFGEKIAKFQAVSHRIVDMAVRVEAAQGLLYRMAWLRSQGKKASKESSMLKLFVSESWVQTSLDQIQLHGALGYMAETGVEQNLRDAIASRIYSGTSEIQKNIIARALRL